MAEEHAKNLLLYNSTFCRLCGEENSNGSNLFISNKNDADIVSMINHYLPIKVNIEDTNLMEAVV